MNRQCGADFHKHKWPLLALWISIGLHGALIALVKIVPHHARLSVNTIEARLMPRTAAHPVPLYLPELKSFAVDDALAYAPALPAPEVEQQPSSPTQQASLLPQIEMPLAVDLHYYSARELDVTPRGLIPDPVLPNTLSGKIKYQVKIEEDGRVSAVDVMSVELTAGADAAVVASTEALLRATRFKPGMKHGRPVRALVVYELVINAAEPQRPQITD